jgi:hypothetical protein
VASGYTLIAYGDSTLSVSTISGSGTLSVASGCTITVAASSTWSVSTVSGSGAVSVASGYTLTVGANITWGSLALGGAGTLSVASGYTLTIGASVTWTISNIGGAGTVSVASGYTLTQGGAMTLSVSTVSVAGTWANNGQGLTIASGATVSWTTTGSLTTASTAGTLTINGTLYYYGISVTSGGTSDPGLPSFPLSLAGSGIGIFTTNKSGSGGVPFSISNASIAAGSNYTNGVLPTASIIPYIALTSVEGSATGKYAFGAQVKGYYYPEALIYIGTANTAYSVSVTVVDGSADQTGAYYYLYNSSSSAGTITVSGTYYF